MHLLLCLDELDGRREERRCEATACTSDENLGERWLFVIRPYLDLQEKTVRRKEQPVKYRCGGLSPEVGLYSSSALFVQLVLDIFCLACAERTLDVPGETRCP